MGACEGRAEPVAQPATSLRKGGARVTLCPTNGRSEEQALREALQVVEHSDALVRRTVLNLSRNCPSHLICEAARGKLLELRSHLEEALEALANIERRRGLTD